MVGSNSGKVKNLVNRCNPPVKSNPYIMVTRSPIAPCKGKAIKTKVLQSIIIQSISKILHMVFKLIQPSLFLLNQQYFIESPKTTYG